MLEDNKKKLLLIAHTPSENTRKLANAVMKGASHPDVGNILLQCRAPLDTQAEDILTASGIIIGTTENLGYMAGLTKDVFDRCYYPCLEHTQGLPYSVYIRAGNDGRGTQRSIQNVATGLRWRLVQEPLILRGDFQSAFLKQCEDLGLSMAASLDLGII